MAVVEDVGMKGLSYRLMMARIHVRIWAESQWGDVKTAWWFVVLGWRILTRKLLIIDISDSTANGGFKYRMIVMSHRPLSSTKPYNF